MTLSDVQDDQYLYSFTGGKKYHKGCHKCSQCGKLLSTTNAHLHGGELHCRTCHAHVMRPASPALFPDTSVIKPLDEAHACPKCKGSVFEAEKIVEKGKVYHKRCFVCCKCSRPQDDKLQVATNIVLPKLIFLLSDFHWV